MKKLVLPISGLAFLVLLFCFSGCKRTVKVTENKIGFDSISIAETYYLFSDSQKPSCNLQIQFLYPKTCQDEKLLSKLQLLFTEKFFGEDFASVNPQEAAQKYKDQYIAEFKQFEESVGTEKISEMEEESDETGHSYYAHIQNEVVFNKNNLVSFKVEYNNYEGGVHGSHSIYGFVFDLLNESLISEDQLFEGNYKKVVTSILIEKIAEANNLENPKDLENIGYGSIEDIVPNGNFIVENNGIRYFFNENEIAAYVMGITEVFIPYKEIKLYMKKDGPVGQLSEL